jgi:hypothetical protein
MNSQRVLVALAATLVLGSGRVVADDEPVAPPAGATAAARAAVPRLEGKRSMTNRGTADESTRTTFRAEVLLDGTLSLLRLDLPWVDGRSDLQLSPQDVEFGDLKARVGLRPLKAMGGSLSLFLDLTMPTGAAGVGGRTWQLGPGGSLRLAIPAPWLPSGVKLSSIPLLQQVFSVAEPADAKDVNYTIVELPLELQHPGAWIANLKLKPVVDWTRDGAVGAVLELKGSWIISSDWTAWLTLGHRAWGAVVPSTYEEKIELGIRLTL